MLSLLIPCAKDGAKQKASRFDGLNTINTWPYSQTDIHHEKATEVNCVWLANKVLVCKLWCKIQRFWRKSQFVNTSIFNKEFHWRKSPSEMLWKSLTLVTEMFGGFYHLNIILLLTQHSKWEVRMVYSLILPVGQFTNEILVYSDRVVCLGAKRNE